MGTKLVAVTIVIKLINSLPLEYRKPMTRCVFKTDGKIDYKKYKKCLYNTDPNFLNEDYHGKKLPAKNT